MLMAAAARPSRGIAGASCHDAREIEQAERLGLDYIVVGPVEATASHPGAQPLEWEGFAALARERSMPVYAIGGLTRADAAEARRHGAHGLALLGQGLPAV
jgi:8-oxo-dGTP diphosphatase